MTQECEQSAEILKEEIPAVSNLRDVTLEHLHDDGTPLSDHLYRRSLHVITVNDRVLQATEALERGDFQFFGQLLYNSHASLRNDYQVSCPEIDFLVDQTEELDFVLVVA
ncbi:MAG: hypothetical protein OEM26_03910 [Saprospiraceae bacterium]|nr:hypothetical protein [Saprospiraceae bacterium]